MWFENENEKGLKWRWVREEAFEPESDDNAFEWTGTLKDISNSPCYHPWYQK